MNTLIAKPIIKNQFWVITDGTHKVGNVVATGCGYEVKLNGSTSHFDSTKSIKHIEFRQNVTKPTPTTTSFNEYPTTAKVFNSLLDVKRKIHLYTKTTKSKCYHAAGWFTVKQGSTAEVMFCPKYIFIQRYEYTGPYKTKDEANSSINTGC